MIEGIPSTLEVMIFMLIPPIIMFAWYFTRPLEPCEDDGF